MKLGSRRNAIARPNVDVEIFGRFKLVMLGMSGAGKTSLLDRFIKNTFTERLTISLGAIFHTQTMNIDDKIIKLDIWDTAGQERFRSLVPMFYRGTHAAIVVYDIQRQDSFQSAKDWISRLKEEAPEIISIALVGNKTDFADRRQVDFKEAETFAEENDLIFMETSAKTGVNVEDIFLAIAKKLVIEFSVKNWYKSEMRTIRLTEEIRVPLYKRFTARFC